MPSLHHDMSRLPSLHHDMSQMNNKVAQRDCARTRAGARGKAESTVRAGRTMQAILVPRDIQQCRTYAERVAAQLLNSSAKVTA
jgi:hypothetical protein